MKKNILLIVFLTCSTSVFCQETDSINIHDRTKLVLDSIEIRITENKWGTDTFYYIHYTLSNKSNDTLTFITNSCPKHYHNYLLKSKDQIYHLQEFLCWANVLTPHKISPKSSLSISENISLAGTESVTEKTFVPYVRLDTGDTFISFTIPVVFDSINQIRAHWGEYRNAMIFEGDTKVVMSKTVNIKKPKKRKLKSSTNL